MRAANAPIGHVWLEGRMASLLGISGWMRKKIKKRGRFLPGSAKIAPVSAKLDQVFAIFGMSDASFAWCCLSAQKKDRQTKGRRSINIKWC
ncbi:MULTISPECIES: hypothetical protein [unclassified Rhizobium]|uniref:hypothetical protein n=1 Tax=unclassified Rhizobium TaxID=2613769 RepID=UPI001ADA223E|nr:MULTISPECIES: hypothetical protein [unclassified Rhizobium]MBO9125100.1 hypothetical protein [Rhizobium sp. 16-488-2b]MBO9175685.1 hypothetical protein [Rhizobium sp. 16-488-2a]